MSHAPAGKKAKKHEEEEHENHERWLVTYADMLTVLMALFIVLFALGTPNKEKFNAMAEGLSNGLGGPVGIITSSNGVLGQRSDSMMNVDLLTAVKPPSESSIDRALAAQKDTDKLQEKLRARAEANRLREIQKQLQKALEEAQIPDAAKFRIDERGLVVNIVTDKVLFEADKADLQPGGRKVLTAIAPVLAKNTNGLLVEGHTNTVAVKPKFFASEWELSSARAASVVRFLIAEQRLAAKRFTVVGFADQHPLYPTSDPRANDLNRRVELIVQTTLPGAARSLLAGEAKIAEAEEKAKAEAAAKVDSHGADPHALPEEHATEPEGASADEAPAEEHH